MYCFKFLPQKSYWPQFFKPDYSFLNTVDERKERLEQATVVDTKINKKRNPDFPGFSNDSITKCTFLNDESNNKEIQLSKLKEILKDANTNSFDKAVRVCDLYIEAYDYILSKHNKADCLFLGDALRCFQKIVLYQDVWA